VGSAGGLSAPLFFSPVCRKNLSLLEKETQYPKVSAIRQYILSTVVLVYLSSFTPMFQIICLELA
jgi:hypothetical protein